MMGQIGPWQIVLIAVLVILVFGAKRLPDTARSLGKSLRILKSETAAMKNDGAKTDADASTSAPADTTAPRTIQAAPGDIESSRPVDEPRRTSQG
ncbi:Sec-independent protein translocase subunit TatA [Streptomyces marincola]|uniref:Sec-independent protein translocase protein TatA n=1 Tax=Streptomyces marincola TaxID=2878388 RepID=A0A1W7D6C5_9ACTN|nr:Sec-independent protein translocase subunit TatA [Streptomyces marincola]ARQ72628.1 twin-arginine translocase TatA/TatE family subunit [Streptomyces marincola]